MQKVKVALYAITPEEAGKLPRGTQVIEYDTATGRMRVKITGKMPAFDFLTCLYLLAAPEKVGA